MQILCVNLCRKRAVPTVCIYTIPNAQSSSTYARPSRLFGRSTSAAVDTHVQNNKLSWHRDPNFLCRLSLRLLSSQAGPLPLLQPALLQSPPPPPHGLSHHSSVVAPFVNICTSLPHGCFLPTSHTRVWSNFQQQHLITVFRG